MPVVDSTYAPPPLLSGGHVQTLFAKLTRRVDLAYARRERIDTPDGDFLDLDWAFALADRPADRVAVVTHGLEGSADRTYVRGMAQALVRRGWDVCAWNMRGCSGEPNRRVFTYHSGKTEDLDRVVEHVVEAGSPRHTPANGTGRAGYDAVALVGFSLGGNLTLKYLGERGASVDERMRGAVAISTPVDLAASSRRISAATNWHYTQYFLRSLRETIRVKAEQHPGAVHPDRFDAVRTLSDFDDAYTAPLNGFRDAADYYAQASSAPLLPNLALPTLLVNAANDPFLADECYPFAVARDHEALTLEVPDSGGHVGFVTFGNDGEYWSERRTASFLDAAVPNGTDPSGTGPTETASRETAPRETAQGGTAPNETPAS